jgi:flagellar biosynthesis regulator FlaF
MAVTQTEERGPSIVDRTGDLVSALQAAGYGHAEIIDALLFEAGWMIEVVASGEASHLASKADLRRIIGSFSDICAQLIEPNHPLHPGHH